MSCHERTIISESVEANDDVENETMKYFDQKTKESCKCDTLSLKRINVGTFILEHVGEIMTDTIY